MDVGSGLLEVERDGIGRDDDFEVAADVLVERVEDRGKLEVVVGGDLVGGGLGGKGAERPGEAGEVEVKLFGVAILGVKVLLERGQRRAEGMEEPIVGHIEGGGAYLELAFAALAPDDGGDALLQVLDEAFEQEQEAFVGGDAEAGRDEVGLHGEAAFAVAVDEGERVGDAVGGELGLTDEG